MDNLIIYFDQSRLKQVCINLLDNAIKYNYDGGTITANLDADEHSIICRISDKGSISVRSEPGKGTMFTLLLPHRDSNGEPG